MWKRIDSIVADAVQHTQRFALAKLENTTNKQNFFSLLRMDFMLDRDVSQRSHNNKRARFCQTRFFVFYVQLQPILVDANEGPDLESRTPELAKLYHKRILHTVLKLKGFFIGADKPTGNQAITLSLPKPSYTYFIFQTISQNTFMSTQSCAQEIRPVVAPAVKRGGVPYATHVFLKVS